MKQMLGPQRPYQRILDQIVGDLRVARQRPRIAAQSRYRRLDALPETVQAPVPKVIAGDRSSSVLRDAAIAKGQTPALPRYSG
jgi:hypothetical protein